MSVGSECEWSGDEIGDGEGGGKLRTARQGVALPMRSCGFIIRVVE
jgi:hypothetical protein